MKKNYKISIVFFVFVASLTVYCNAQATDSLQELKWRPYEILRNINERPVFVLDTNGYTIQFGYSTLLANIYEYFSNQKYNIEDSLLLRDVKEINNAHSEIIVNKLPENIKTRTIHHLADLMTKGKCKIVNNQNKKLISRIACVYYLYRDNSGGKEFVVLDQENEYKEVLKIQNK